MVQRTSMRQADPDVDRLLGYASDRTQNNQFRVTRLRRLADRVADHIGSPRVRHRSGRLRSAIVIGLGCAAASTAGVPAAPQVIVNEPRGLALLPSPRSWRRASSRHVRALARVVSARPHDLADPALWVNQHYCLGRQLLRRASPSAGEIAPDGFGQLGAGFDPERAPEKIYASA
jgi:hypothetical protein